MRRSKSIILKQRPIEEEPKKLKRNVSATTEIRMSALPPPKERFIFISKSFDLKDKSTIKILKPKYHPKVQHSSTLDGLDKVEFERLNPDYQNKSQSYRHRYKIFSQNPMQDIGIMSIMAKIDERKQKFDERYQRLFGPNYDKYSASVLSARSDLAEMRAPRVKGYKSQFYESVKAMLEKI